MTTPEVHELARGWRAVRRLHKAYSGIAREAQIEPLPCAELDSPIDHSDPEVLQRAEVWLNGMDDLISVYHLRLALQTTLHGDEELLQLLLDHHLKKEHKNEGDRDKLDFLLAQYFAQNAPTELNDEEIDFTRAAQVLQKVLGKVSATGPSQWDKQANELLATARACEQLNDLLEKGVLEEGRNLKVSSGVDYFSNSALVTFTRFSYLLRKIFFTLLHAEVEDTFEVLRHLQQVGVTAVDCRDACLSDSEPPSSLCEMCQEWQAWFRAEYEAGEPLRQLVQIHRAAQRALASHSEPARGKKKKAAAAGAGGGAGAASA